MRCRRKTSRFILVWAGICLRGTAARRSASQNAENGKDLEVLWHPESYRYYLNAKDLYIRPFEEIERDAHAHFGFAGAIGDGAATTTDSPAGSAPTSQGAQTASGNRSGEEASTKKVLSSTSSPVNVISSSERAARFYLAGREMSADLKCAFSYSPMIGLGLFSIQRYMLHDSSSNGNLARAFGIGAIIWPVLHSMGFWGNMHQFVFVVKYIGSKVFRLWHQGAALEKSVLENSRERPANLDVRSGGNGQEERHFEVENKASVATSSTWSRPVSFCDDAWRLLSNVFSAVHGMTRGGAPAAAVGAALWDARGTKTDSTKTDSHSEDPPGSPWYGGLFDLLYRGFYKQVVEVFIWTDPEILEYEILLLQKGHYYPPLERERLAKILYNIRAGFQQYNTQIIDYLDEALRFPLEKTGVGRGVVAEGGSGVLAAAVSNATSTSAEQRSLSTAATRKNATVTPTLIFGEVGELVKCSAAAGTEDFVGAEGASCVAPENNSSPQEEQLNATELILQRERRMLSRSAAYLNMTAFRELTEPMPRDLKQQLHAVAYEYVRKSLANLPSKKMYFFYGNPGSGKTYTATRLLRDVLNLPVCKIRLASNNLESVVGSVTGSDSKSIGEIAACMKKHQRTDVGIVFDDGDRSVLADANLMAPASTSGAHDGQKLKTMLGDVGSFLQDISDLETTTFYNPFFGRELDISNVLFVLTANFEFEGTAFDALNDRLSFVRFPNFSTAHKTLILRQRVEALLQKHFSSSAAAEPEAEAVAEGGGEALEEAPSFSPSSVEELRTKLHAQIDDCVRKAAEAEQKCADEQKRTKEAKESNATSGAGQANTSIDGGAESNATENRNATERAVNASEGVPRTAMNNGTFGGEGQAGAKKNATSEKISAEEAQCKTSSQAKDSIRGCFYSLEAFFYQNLALMF
eukprot:g16716.t1